MQTLEQLQSGELIGTKNLKLSCGLKNFPREIFTLADTLEQLDLSGNQLSELPENFYFLKNLKILFLSENQFTIFPSVLSKCLKLDIIGFKANKISLIEEDSFPPNLRWLILTNNDLPELPRTIGKCYRLQKLMLAGNQLKSLPIELAACNNLELLRISANQIEKIPNWLVCLPKLSWLAFAGNPCSAQVIQENIQEIDWQNLTLKDKLGEGASGTIYRGELLEKETQAIALKIFKGEITSDGFPEDEMNASILAGNHSNLVKLIGKLSNHPENKKGLVLELISDNYENLGHPPNFKTCTRDTYKESLSFSLEEILKVLIGVSSAIKHIHSRGLMHGDLYAHNILINKENSQILLGDFGATSYYGKDSKLAGSLIRLEVRAFACLAEDLLERLDAKLESINRVEELKNLTKDCFKKDVLARPDFVEIYQRLEKINKEYF